jgi:hypothetical protein
LAPADEEHRITRVAALALATLRPREGRLRVIRVGLRQSLIRPQAPISSIPLQARGIQGQFADNSTRLHRTKIEVFCDSPDAFIALALRPGPKGSLDDIGTIKDLGASTGFIDPFGHIWLVGDKSPLDAFSKR